MSAASPFLALLTICGFLFSVWSAAKVSSFVGVSPMLLEMAVGVLLGPGVLSLISNQYQVCENRRWVHCEVPQDLYARLDGGLHVPKGLRRVLDEGLCSHEEYAKASAGDEHAQEQLRYDSFEECLLRNCEHETSEQCERTPDIFTLIGHAGVGLMIFESGMHFDYEKFKVVGAHACGVATVGTLLPLVTGAALVYAFGYPVFPDGIAAGTALAPTSCGVALRLLREAGALQEEFGQAIMTAAFVDDVLSLIMFNFVFSIAGEGGFDMTNVVILPSAGVAFMVLASFLAVKGWPFLMTKVILPSVPEKRGEHKISAADEAILFTMMVTLVGYAALTHFLGNHLWGCYFAGMSFACLREKEQAHHVWEAQTKRISMWLVRIFFSCTIAFSIPVNTLFSWDAIWKGLLMGLGPCILTKVCSGLWMGRPRFVIGWAMVGRAEFNFLIAQMAVTAKMINEEMYSVVIWAFLFATFAAPIVFRGLLKRLMSELHLPTHSASQVKVNRGASGVTTEDEGDESDDTPEDVQASWSNASKASARQPTFKADASATVEASGAALAALPAATKISV